VQAELERIKLEIKELNLKHKDKIVEAPSYEENSSNYSDRDMEAGAADINNTTI
jgi:hypothetical protein